MGWRVFRDKFLPFPCMDCLRHQMHLRILECFFIDIVHTYGYRRDIFNYEVDTFFCHLFCSALLSSVVVSGCLEQESAVLFAPGRYFTIMSYCCIARFSGGLGIGLLYNGTSGFVSVITANGLP